MIKTSCLLTFLLVSVSAFNALAQKHDQSYSTTPVADELGRAVPVNKYGKVKGSPFLFDDWMTGKVVTEDGKTYKKMLFKYNIETDMLTFVYNKTDEPLKFAEPVKSFTLNADRERTFADNFPKIDGYHATSFYEVVAPGKTMLLKHYKEVIKDVRDDNMAPIDGLYLKGASYYIFRDAKMFRTKLNKDAVLQALSDKAPQINTYLANTAIDFHKEEDVKKLFDYYNGLQ
ncbi:hypothetical protein [Mucilaginibacter polytrichastri]|uniref:Uncharacterized protein n=1 Tax=Mucilaginibacter polytrichastri TaxID=1302689 RepID=A0A1Q6A0G9_9SPHI|nr:hypothetical protein [Mucilaginibacter polytrichastri]OKS87515.1 hypothetical protein RG47T_2976 [Mucilaginibacter polytrichastri]SFS91598.1 hypothetical protein SAMN04487890_106110 [Mucilaginibacter polytrichastri]